MKSRDVAIHPSPTLNGAKETQGLPQRSAPAAAATAPDLGEVFERVGSLSSPQPGNSPTASTARERPQSGSQRSSGMRQRRQHAAGTSSSQGAAAKGDTSGASKQQQQQQPAIREHEESAPVPLEYFGIHIFRTLGLAPALRQVDLYVSSLAERVNEGMVVRVVCLPIAIHCLFYAVMARLRFLVSTGARVSRAANSPACLYMFVAVMGA